MRLFEGTKFITTSVSIITLMVLVGMITITVEAADTTTVSIDPSSQTVSPGDTFTVDVYCIPGQPIKAFELKLSFDASLLQANSMTEGTIFDGYNTFFNPGTIDNSAGTIVDVYNLIIGPGNVSDPGTFINISFTTKEAAGVSSLDLYEAGVTDEAGYLSITVNDGSVTVQGTDDDSDPPSPPPGGGGSSGGGGGGGTPHPAGGDDDQNNPPDTPIKPSGPTFVEIGVEYTYSTSTSDVDGNSIRFQFDWGDGSYSDWSEFVESNISVTMSHSWNSISSYEVGVIAQDENGTNSSWSPYLEVTVSQVGSEDDPPVIDVEVTNNESTNQTIVFDASGSYDIDGAIISYHWDFGDGETGSGKNPIHTYQDPGTYIVILTITDNNGKEYSKTISITVGSEVEEESEDEGMFPFYFVIGIIGFTVVILVCLVVFFRDTIISSVSKHRSHLFSHGRIFDKKDKIEKLDKKMEEIKKIQEKIDFEKSPDGTMDKYYNEIQNDYSRAKRYIDSEIESNSGEKKSFDESDKDDIREKINKLLKGNYLDR